MQEKSPEVYIAIGTAIGAFLTKTLGAFLRRKFSEADSIRRELREEVSSLKVEILRLQKSLDEEKLERFKLLEENIYLRNQCSEIKCQLESLAGKKLYIDQSPQ